MSEANRGIYAPRLGNHWVRLPRSTGLGVRKTKPVKFKFKFKFNKQRRQR